MSTVFKRLMIFSGALGLFFGVVIYSSRLKLASAFLNAQILFGMPFSGVDAKKIVFVSIIGFGIIAISFIILLTGLLIKDKSAIVRVCSKCGSNLPKNANHCSRCERGNNNTQYVSVAEKKPVAGYDKSNAAQPANVKNEYTIFFTGKIRKGNEIEKVKRNLAVIFKKDVYWVNRLFEKEKVVIIKKANFETVKKIWSLFEKAGAVCEVEKRKDAAAAGKHIVKPAVSLKDELTKKYLNDDKAETKPGSRSAKSSKRSVSVLLSFFLIVVSIAFVLVYKDDIEKIANKYNTKSTKNEDTGNENFDGERLSRKSSLTWAEINENAKSMTDVRFDEYSKTLKGKPIKWKGYVTNVQHSRGPWYTLYIHPNRYKKPQLLMGIPNGEHAAFYISKSMASKIKKKNQLIEFSGVISSVDLRFLSHYFAAISITDPHILNISLSESERLDDMFAEAQFLYSRRKHIKAINLYHIAADRGHAASQNSLGWIYATAKHKRHANGKLAVKYALMAAEQSERHHVLDTLAAAYARNGQFEKAVEDPVKSDLFIAE